jgi:signal transduction histidine kinase
MSARLIALLVRPTSPPLAVGVAVAASFIAAETLLVCLLEKIFPGMTFGVVFLLGVLVVSAGWGFGLAVSTTFVSALVYAFVHLSVDGSIFPITTEDWVAIIVFVPVALLANVLVGQARLRAAEANRRRGEAEESRDELRLLADQQAALRRIATLVARAVAPYGVFSAVTEELARCLGVTHASLVRYDADGSAVLLASHDDRGSQKKIPVGKRFSFDGESVAAMVGREGRAARRDSHGNGPSEDLQFLHQLGLCSGVGVPIIVGGRLWGAANVGSSRHEPLPANTEARVGDFADLVATAIANADARTELTASRARIVAASDAARRRFERDLHDGAQQQLVSLGLQLRTAKASLPESDVLRERLSDVVTGLTGVSEDLQEISRGIHPAILSSGGLGPALKTLARRSSVPVEFCLGIDRRLPDSVEVAAYYVVAEAFTNVAKYAQASEVTVSIDADAANLRLSIADDGVGGADPRKGSGLIGLIDRVEALGGQLQISSVVGSGTSLLATIPCTES